MYVTKINLYKQKKYNVRSKDPSSFVYMTNTCSNWWLNGTLEHSLILADYERKLFTCFAVTSNNAPTRQRATR